MPRSMNTKNEEGVMELRKEMEKEFPGIEIRYVDPLSLSISCHIGPGALGIAVTQILDETK